MQKLISINQNRDFRRVYSRGKAYVHPALVTYVFKTRAGFCRFGITTGKKIGSAVKRNRCRRIIYHAFRNVYGGVTQSCDIVFVARSRTVSLKSTDMERIITKQLTAAGLLGRSKRESSPSAAPHDEAGAVTYAAPPGTVQ